MKNVLVAFALVTAFTACNSKKSETRDTLVLADSIAYKNNINSDTSKMTQALASPATGKPGSVPPQKTTSSTGSNTSTSSTSGSVNTTTQTTTRKKGWSSATKGAVIGAGAGAIGGAIINKNKPVQGAIVGGVVGAAGGYIIGNEIDKKKGQ